MDNYLFVVAVILSVFYFAFYNFQRKEVLIETVLVLFIQVKWPDSKSICVIYTHYIHPFTL